jgi:hypothetical protein
MRHTPPCHASVRCTDSHLFNAGGVAAVIHGSTVWVGNTNGDSINCAEGYDITGNGTGPQWPVGMKKDLEFVVDAAGKIASFSISGVAASIYKPDAPTLNAAPACKPVLIAPGTPIYFGASGNEAYNDNFCGRVASVSIARNTA